MLDSSLFMYFIHAGLVVKCVMGILLLASILSWTNILQRSLYFRRVSSASKNFEKAFWASADFAELYHNCNKSRRGIFGTEAIFYAGFKEFLRLYKQSGLQAESILESVKRAMRVAQMAEQEQLEISLPTLATVGSISPYVGLFGTVWGIMMSFRALANVQQATISMVAPGIAEALIATALGLFAAIPAVVAYNRFVSDINNLLNRFDSFQDEFSNILFRQLRVVNSTSTKNEPLVMSD